MGLDRLANMMGDAHTCVRFPRDTPDLPLAFRGFGTDYCVVAVAPGLERALGARLVRINEMPLERVHELVLPLTPQDENPPLREANLAVYLTNDVRLHGLGISSSRDSARYTLADSSGQEFTVDVHATHGGGTEPAWSWALS